LKRSDYLDLFDLDSSSVVRMIERPAEIANLDVSEVIGELIKETMNGRSMLPLLSTTLTTLWENRKGNTLSGEMLKALGGISGVIGERANSAFATFEEKYGIEIAEAAFDELFSMLIRVDLEGLPVRKVSSVENFKNSHTVELAKVFANEKTRLIYFGAADHGSGQIVDVVHEAIFSNWEKLSNWIAARRKYERDLAQAERDAKEWELHDRDISRLSISRIHDAHMALISLGKPSDMLAGSIRDYLFPKSYLMRRLSQSLKDTSVGERAQIGRLLDQIERVWSGSIDERSGVGISESGLPTGGTDYWLNVKSGKIDMPLTPLKSVSQEVKSPFRIAKYPITQAQFKAFLDAEDGYS
jgi:hypothetical protein